VTVGLLIEESTFDAASRANRSARSRFDSAKAAKFNLNAKQLGPIPTRDKMNWPHAALNVRLRSAMSSPSRICELGS
jgi:hypothetical protein